MSSTKEVLEKIQELLSHLVERCDTFVIYLKPFIENAISNVVFCLKTRMHKDGRLPQTFRLTIRRYSATNKWFSRESRQAPIPNHVAQKIISGKLRDTATQAPDTLRPHPDVQIVFCHVCRQPGWGCGPAAPTGHETLPQDGGQQRCLSSHPHQRLLQ